MATRSMQMHALSQAKLRKPGAQFLQGGTGADDFQVNPVEPRAGLNQIEYAFLAFQIADVEDGAAIRRQTQLRARGEPGAWAKPVSIDAVVNQQSVFGASTELYDLAGERLADGNHAGC